MPKHKHKQGHKAQAAVPEDDVSATPFVIDANFSYRITDAVKRDYPGSTHVDHLGLHAAKDDKIWERTKSLGAAILTRDSDFFEWVQHEGSPPKVVRLGFGVGTMSDVTRALHEGRHEIRQFLDDPKRAYLEVQRPDQAGPLMFHDTLQSRPAAKEHVFQTPAPAIVAPPASSPPAARPGF